MARTIQRTFLNLTGEDLRSLSQILAFQTSRGTTYQNTTVAEMMVVPFAAHRPQGLHP